MKKAILLLVLMATAQLIAQEQSTITVKSSETTDGVVIVAATLPSEGHANTPVSLQCNKGASACKAPDPGTYLMVRLPKNWGMYDCANVDLYPTTANPTTDQKIGEYCLNQK